MLGQSPEHALLARRANLPGPQPPNSPYPPNQVLLPALEPALALPGNSCDARAISSALLPPELWRARGGGGGGGGAPPPSVSGGGVGGGGGDGEWPAVAPSSVSRVREALAWGASSDAHADMLVRLLRDEDSDSGGDGCGSSSDDGSSGGEGGAAPELRGVARAVCGPMARALLSAPLPPRDAAPALACALSGASPHAAHRERVRDIVADNSERHT
jgi:hypothetical protein